MNLDTIKKMPWSQYEDVSIHPNEYLQISTINRPAKRLLDDILWLLKCCLIVGGDNIVTSQDLAVSGIYKLKHNNKFLKVEDLETNKRYYIPIFEEET